jgi:RNA 2',3'-cyclic 3'-phosphodiesterase
MRLFVALEIPGETRDALADLIAQLKPKHASAKWIRPEAMHITLKFIGHTADENLAPIAAALAKIHSPQPIELHFRGLGFFPNERRPRVFWCGVESSANTAAIAAELDRALIALGIAAETRPFSAHLTLARFREDAGRQRGMSARHSAAAIVAAARELQAKDFGLLRTCEFHLFQSKLAHSGAEYTRLQTFRFV